jgi:hypothetical protein
MAVQSARKVRELKLRELKVQGAKAAVDVLRADVPKVVNDLDRVVLAPAEDLAARAKAAANISGAKRSASSAWKRSSRLITRTFACYRSLSPRTGRSFRAA